MNQSRHDSPWIGSNRISKKRAMMRYSPFISFINWKEKQFILFTRRKNVSFFHIQKTKPFFNGRTNYNFLLRFQFLNVTMTFSMFVTPVTRFIPDDRGKTEQNFTLDTYFMRLWWKKEKLTMTESDNGALWSNRGGNWDTILAHFLIVEPPAVVHSSALSSSNLRFSPSPHFIVRSSPIQSRDQSTFPLHDFIDTQQLSHSLLSLLSINLHLCSALQGKGYIF